MHHNYSVISGNHACTYCVWPEILGAGLHTTYRGELLLVVIRFNVTFLPLRPYCEKLCTCFLKDAERPTIYGCPLWCSQIVCPYSLNTTTAFYFVIERSDVIQCWFVRGRLHAATHSWFTWPWPGLDSASYSAEVVLYQVLRLSE